MEKGIPENTSDFLEETIKSRPKNRRRFVKHMIEVVVFAVLFGVVACVTMILVSPLLEDRFFAAPESEVEITFAEEIPNYRVEEIQPEDMLLEEAEPVMEVTEVVIDTEEQLLDMVRLLNEKVSEYSRWLVQVAGVSNEVSWLESTNISANVTSGAVIADNGTELLILTDQGCLSSGAEHIWVTFADRTGALATIKGSDTESGLMVLAVEKAQLEEETLQSCSIAQMSSSNNKALVGSLVMALGAPNGNIGSVNYGIISSIGTQVSDWDCNYRLIMTNMHCNSTPNGFLVNLRGEMIGIVCNEYNAEDSKHMLSALGVSELKRKIERMSNGDELPVLGIKGTEVTEQAQLQNDIPDGAYVTAVRLDSPAMQSGIQAGDVIIRIGDNDISSMTGLVNRLYQLKAGDKTELVIMRQSQGTYKESTVQITLGKQ